MIGMFNSKETRYGYIVAEINVATKQKSMCARNQMPKQVITKRRLGFIAKLIW